MENYLPILEKAPLFAGIGRDELRSLLSCLDAREVSLKKGEYLLHAGDEVTRIMIPVQGELHIQREDHWGNRTILRRVLPGEMLGEAYLSAGHTPSLNDVVALSDSTVILLHAKRMLTTCSSACRFHTLVVQNLFLAISEKNRHLMQKLTHMSKRTTREKLLSYLSDEARRRGSTSFTIPFNRQQLADYLSVDRSAMSNELCKMRDEGLLTFDKSRFTLSRAANYQS